VTSTRNGPPPRRPPGPSAPTRPQRRTRTIHPGVVVVFAFALFVLLLVLHHFHHAAPPKRAVAVTTTTRPVQLTVASATCTFVDPSRTTKDYVTETTTPGCRLITDIYYPAIESDGKHSAASVPARRLGPFPTILFAGGYGIDPSSYAALLDRWVADGFVVIAPRFPDASVAAVAALNGGDADEADIPNEPGDLTFVTRRAIAISAGTAAGCPVLRGLVSANALGLAGQSDGATVVAMLGFDHGDLPGTTTTYASLRTGINYRAVAVLSGAAYGADPYAGGAGSPALLSVNSATDTCNTPTQAVDLYSAIVQADRWFLAITSADHLTPYEGQDAAAFEVVAQVTAAYFTDELGGVTPGASFLAIGNREPSVAALVHGTDLPSDLNVDNGDGGVDCYAT